MDTPSSPPPRILAPTAFFTRAGDESPRPPPVRCNGRSMDLPPGSARPLRGVRVPGSQSATDDSDTDTDVRSRAALAAARATPVPAASRTPRRPLPSGSTTSIPTNGRPSTGLSTYRSARSSAYASAYGSTRASVNSTYESAYSGGSGSESESRPPSRPSFSIPRPTLVQGQPPAPPAATPGDMRRASMGSRGSLVSPRASLTLSRTPRPGSTHTEMSPMSPTPHAGDDTAPEGEEELRFPTSASANTTTHLDLLPYHEDGDPWRFRAESLETASTVGDKLRTEGGSKPLSSFTQASRVDSNLTRVVTNSTVVDSPDKKQSVTDLRDAASRGWHTSTPTPPQRSVTSLGPLAQHPPGFIRDSPHHDDVFKSPDDGRGAGPAHWKGRLIPLPRFGAERTRKYRLWRGGNRFLFGGLGVTSQAPPWAALGSFALVLALPAVWMAWDGRWIARNISPGPVVVVTYFWLSAIVAMVHTACSDPGVLPRCLDLRPPCRDLNEQERISDCPREGAQPAPRRVRVGVQGRILKLKWCETCHTYRPPRCSHCRSCDNCVENIDHHCTFLNNCVGRRNYTSFLWLLFVILTDLMLMLALCVAHLVMLTWRKGHAYPRAHHVSPGLSFGGALRNSPSSAVVGLISAILMAPVSTLIGYHIRLLWLNRSTVEQIRLHAARTVGADAAGLDEDVGAETEDQGSNGNPRRSVLHTLAGGFTAPFRVLLPGVEGDKASMFPSSSNQKISPRHTDPNPFARPGSGLRNMLTTLSRPYSLSWMDRRGWDNPDTRHTNPAFLPGSHSDVGGNMPLVTASAPDSSVSHAGHSRAYSSGETRIPLASLARTASSSGSPPGALGASPTTGTGSDAFEMRQRF